MILLAFLSTVPDSLTFGTAVFFSNLRTVCTSVRHHTCLDWGLPHLPSLLEFSDDVLCGHCLAKWSGDSQTAQCVQLAARFFCMHGSHASLTRRCCCLDLADLSPLLLFNCRTSFFNEISSSLKVDRILPMFDSVSTSTSRLLTLALCFVLVDVWCLMFLSVLAWDAWLTAVINSSSETSGCRRRGLTSLTTDDDFIPVSIALRNIFCTSSALYEISAPGLFDARMILCLRLIALYTNSMSDSLSCVRHVNA